MGDASMPARSQAHLLVAVLDTPFAGGANAGIARKTEENNGCDAATGGLIRLAPNTRPSPLTCPVLARAS
jgi:hypothetical protein